MNAVHGRSTRVLVADDEPIARLLLSRQLTGLGHEVVEAEDGLEAWRILSGPEAPRIALLDWQMPGLDGVEVCRRLRARPGGERPFVVLVTSRTATDDVVAGLAAGADDFVAKPFQPAELAARLRSGLRQLALRDAIEGERAWLAAVLSHMDAAVVLTAADGRIAFANEGVAVEGVSSSSLVGSTLAEAEAAGLVGHPDLGGLAPGQVREAVPASDGRVRRWSAFAVPLPDGVGCMRVGRDVTGEVATTRRLEAEALTDHLTGLANRRAGQARLTAGAAALAPGGTIGLVLADIDRFKRLNDEHGHAAGDLALAAVAGRMRQSVRADELVARWGGEELLAIVPGADLAQTFAVAERIRAGIEALEVPGLPTVTVSCGVAVLGHGESPETALARADEALYAAKAAGRNCVR